MPNARRGRGMQSSYHAVLTGGGRPKRNELPAGMRSSTTAQGLVRHSKQLAVLSCTSLPSRSVSIRQPKMSDGDPVENNPIQLDPKALQATIDGVATKLREECTRKPGEHSGSVTASASSGSGGE